MIQSPNLLDLSRLDHYIHDLSRLPVSLNALEKANESDAAASLAQEADILYETLWPGVVDHKVDASAVSEAPDFGALVRCGLVVDSTDLWVQFLHRCDLLVGRGSDDWSDPSGYAEDEGDEADASGT